MAVNVLQRQQKRMVETENSNRTEVSTTRKPTRGQKMGMWPFPDGAPGCSGALGPDTIKVHQISQSSWFIVNGLGKRPLTRLARREGRVFARSF
jgi:hypothetical protein